MANDFAILAAIDAAPSHPYEVLDHLHVLGVEASRGELHRRVETLIVRGAVQAGGEPGRPGERTLRLTLKGQRMLAEHVITLLRYEPFDSPLFALAAICAGSDRLGELHAILQSRIASASTQLTEEETALARSAREDRYWSRVGRERVIAHLQADITWLQSVMSARPGASDDHGSTRLPQAG